MFSDRSCHRPHAGIVEVEVILPMFSRTFGVILRCVALLWPISLAVGAGANRPVHFATIERGLSEFYDFFYDPNRLVSEIGTKPDSVLTGNGVLYQAPLNRHISTQFWFTSGRARLDLGQPVASIYIFSQSPNQEVLEAMLQAPVNCRKTKCFLAIPLVRLHEFARLEFVDSIRFGDVMPQLMRNKSAKILIAGGPSPLTNSSAGNNPNGCVEFSIPTSFHYTEAYYQFVPISSGGSSSHSGCRRPNSLEHPMGSRVLKVCDLPRGEYLVFLSLCGEQKRAFCFGSREIVGDSVITLTLGGSDFEATAANLVRFLH